MNAVTRQVNIATCGRATAGRHGAALVMPGQLPARQREYSLCWKACRRETGTTVIRAMP
jgi:hypothetical protein